MFSRFGHVVTRSFYGRIRMKKRRLSEVEDIYPNIYEYDTQPATDCVLSDKSSTYSISPCLEYEVIGRCSTTKARVGKLNLKNCLIDTPVFMPVGTQGTIKGLLPYHVEKEDCKLILGNAYHLGHRPGEDVMKEMNGLHSFMKWPNGLLTDSGGFQMVSLLKLSTMTEDGVTFTSPHNGTEMLLSPEKSIDIQTSIGANIMMQLDDVVSSQFPEKKRVEEAMHRSLRWLDRCIERQKENEMKWKKKQNLMGIVQGGLFADLRTMSVQQLVERNLPAYAIGGLSGGEEKEKFWPMVHLSTDYLPVNKPRYLMGVGFAIDLIVCVALGCDMFDCVYPTRTARFGVALINENKGCLDLTKRIYKNDFNIIDDDCNCSTCQEGYTRAYLHSIATKETLSIQLITQHNIYYQMSLMKSIRTAIMKDQFPQFIKLFFIRYFQSQNNIPQWCKNALTSVNVEL
ncbi:hypothetical protein SNEBB_007761 [Seison nebaliae]|nr:hypothetical protein SNEBB_007761 [Seison nebaliae]